MILRPLLASMTLLAAAAAQTDPVKAQKAFEQAEQLVARGQFDKAVAAYRDIAKKWPRTEPGVRAQIRTQPNACLGTAPLQVSGRPDNRVDVVVMGDGYMLEQLNSFCDVAKSVPKNMGIDPVLAEYADYHNFTQAIVVSKEDGIDGFGRTYDTALGGYMIKGSHEQAAVDHGAVKKVLEELGDNDGLAIVFVRAGHLGTGGGGVAVIGGREDNTVIHEWGHAFAGLGDEYIDMVHRGTPGRGPNISDSGDEQRVPWRHWLKRKAAGIGVYEGAAGMQRGAWKPTTGGCVMEHGRYYCPVCREAVVRAIYRLVDPIDGSQPAAGGRVVASSDASITVELLRPKTHGLEVRFWTFPAGTEPASPSSKARDRSERGPLPPIQASPSHVVPNAGKSVKWLLPTQQWQPGDYVVVCRVRDDTKVERDTLPWVLDDPQGLLESERRWIVTVR